MKFGSLMLLGNVDCRIAAVKPLEAINVLAGFV